MEMQGNRHLTVTQQQAWDALNDPDVLKACIPGCDKVELAGENEYAIGINARIGPVSARLAGTIRLQDVTPPTSYTLSFEGSGGAAGFGKGQAKVDLAPAAAGNGCELNYTAQSQVGGKIAQLGQRLVDGVARSMAEDFFRRFDAEMERRYPEASAASASVAEALAAPAAGPASPESVAEPSSSSWGWLVWVCAGIVATTAFLLLH
jgi:carbon monoxide dehydrogenase subunit G